MKRFITAKANIIYSTVLALIFALAIYNLFFNLGNFQIANYDEARHGVSAYEMLQTGNYIVNTYRYAPDYWNLKPPLSFWSVILGYKIAGYNALGLRLFAAVFSLMTIVMVALFMLKRHGKLASAVSALVLTTSFQYLTNHGARTGNPDPLYVFFFTVSILALLLSGKNTKWIYLSGLAFSLAFLTKSWHAFIIVAIMGIYLIISGQIRTFRLKQWILLLCCMFLPIAIWGMLRYQYDGLTFFKNMITFDLLRRSESTLEHHVGGKLFYFRILFQYYIGWLCILFGIMLVYLNRNLSFQHYRLLTPEKKACLVGICAWILIPILVFSMAKTKIRWYIMPVYPALSIVIGLLASKVITDGKRMMKIFLIAAILLASGAYELNIYRYVHHDYPNPEQLLVQQLTGKSGIKGSSLYDYKRKKEWPQKIVLAAELAADLRIRAGNFSDFMKSDRGLLLMQKMFYSKKFLSDHRLKVIASNEWGYIVTKIK